VSTGINIKKRQTDLGVDGQNANSVNNTSVKGMSLQMLFHAHNNITVATMG